MPYIDLKCVKCNHIFKQNVERCEELFNHDLCKSHDFETLIDEDKIVVKTSKVDAVIEYVNNKDDYIDVCVKDDLISMLEEIKKKG